MNHELVGVVDFGGQYTQLIAEVRETACSARSSALT
jgi:hypothetical protein